MIVNKEDAMIIRVMLDIYRGKSKRKQEILITQMIVNQLVTYSVYDDDR